MGDTLEEHTNHQGVPEIYDWSNLSEVKYKQTEEKLILLDDFFAKLIVDTEKVIFLDIDIKSNHNHKNDTRYRYQGY